MTHWRRPWYALHAAHNFVPIALNVLPLGASFDVHSSLQCMFMPSSSLLYHLYLRAGRSIDWISSLRAGRQSTWRPFVMMPAIDLYICVEIFNSMTPQYM